MEHEKERKKERRTIGRVRGVKFGIQEMLYYEKPPAYGAKCVSYFRDQRGGTPSRIDSRRSRDLCVDLGTIEHGSWRPDQLWGYWHPRSEWGFVREGSWASEEVPARWLLAVRVQTVAYGSLVQPFVPQIS